MVSARAMTEEVFRVELENFTGSDLNSMAAATSYIRNCLVAQYFDPSKDGFDCRSFVDLLSQMEDDLNAIDVTGTVCPICDEEFEKKPDLRRHILNSVDCRQGMLERQKLGSRD